MATKLAAALEAGKNVKGMVGYVPIKHDGEDIYIKVRLLGLTTEGCGLKVRAKVFAGDGEIDITPCQFLDSTTELKAQRELRKRLDAASKDFKEIGKYHYQHERRKALERYVSARMNGKAKDFEQHVADSLGGRPLTKACSDELMKLAATAVSVVNELGPDEVENRFWRW